MTRAKKTPKRLPSRRVLQLRRVKRLAKLILSSLRFGHQLCKIVWWVSMIKHAVKHPIRIGFAPIGPPRCRIVDPDKNQDSCLGTVSEKQPILLEELRTKPVLSLSTQSSALTIGR